MSVGGVGVGGGGVAWGIVSWGGSAAVGFVSAVGGGAGAGAVASVGAGGVWVVGADSSSVGAVVWARAGKLTAAAPIKSTCFNTFILLYGDLDWSIAFLMGRKINPPCFGKVAVAGHLAKRPVPAKIGRAHV